MRRLIFLSILICFGWQTHAQIGNVLKNKGGYTNGRFNQNDTTFNKFVDVKILGETKYTDYKIISYYNDTT